MSDDDLIRRGDVFRVIHGVADFNRDVVDAIRALPAVPPSPAERLARAADALDKARDDRARASMGPTQPWVQALSRLRTADDEFMSALSAYRAAKPDSTGAAPPAAEPALRSSWVCAICDGGPANDCACSCPDGGKREPARRPVPASEVISSLRAATAAAQAARQDDGKPEPAPCGTCGGSGNLPARHIVGLNIPWDKCPGCKPQPCPSCSPGGAA